MAAPDLEAAAARPAGAPAVGWAPTYRVWRRVALAAAAVVAVTACLAVALRSGDSRGACPRALLPPPRRPRTASATRAACIARAARAARALGLRCAGARLR